MAERILVCGGRDFNDRDLVFKALDALTKKYEKVIIIHGGAPGADALAELWSWNAGLTPSIKGPR